MKNPFFDRANGRPRALWRIIAFSLLCAGGVLGASRIFPLAGLPGLAQHASAAAALAILWILGRCVDRRPFASYGFRMGAGWLADLGFGFALGALLMALVLGMELALGFVRVSGFGFSGGEKRWMRPLGAAFLSCLSVSILEETAMRAYLMRNLAEGFRFGRISAKASLWAAYVLSSSLFGFLHAWNPHASLSGVILISLAGFFLGLPFFLSGELSIPIGLHLSWNFFQGPVFGFPVSGTGFGFSLLRLERLGPDWFTGGSFGPEGGMAGVIAMLAGGILVCLWIRLRRGGLRPRWDLAEYAPPDADAPDRMEGEEARSPSR